MLGVLNQIKRRLRLIGVSILLIVGGFSSAQEQELTSKERLERFELFNYCKPMVIVVESLGDDEDEIGLTRTSLISVVESRLRSARLYDKDALNYLYLNVHVVGVAFSIGLEYKKPLFDPASGEYFLATSWSTGMTGTHGGNASFIRTSVSEFMDKFLVEYLRVNEDHC